MLSDKLVRPLQVLNAKYCYIALVVVLVADINGTLFAIPFLELYGERPYCFEKALILPLKRLHPVPEQIHIDHINVVVSAIR